MCVAWLGWLVVVGEGIGCRRARGVMCCTMLTRERTAEGGVEALDWMCVQAMCFAIFYVLQKGMC
jgi:hypothetical protein